MKPYVRRAVNIRPVKPGDREALAAIWERQKATLGPNPGEFSDPQHPAQFATAIIEDAVTGRVVGAGAARTVCEVAIVLDPDWGAPRDRLLSIADVQATLLPPIWAAGFKHIVARIVGKHRWADRLVQKFGWYRITDPVVGFDLVPIFGGKR